MNRWLLGCAAGGCFVTFVGCSPAVSSVRESEVDSKSPEFKSFVALHSPGAETQNVINPAQFPDKHIIDAQPVVTPPIANPAGYCDLTDKEVKKYKENGIDVEETIFYFGKKIDPTLLRKIPPEEVKNLAYFYQNMKKNLTVVPPGTEIPTEVAVQNYSYTDLAQVDFTYEFENVGDEAKAAGKERIYRWTARRTLFKNRNWGMFGSLLPVSVSDYMPGPTVKFPHDEWYTFSSYGFEGLVVYEWKNPRPIIDVQSLLAAFAREEDPERMADIMKKNPSYWNLKPEFGGGTCPQMIAYATGNKELLDLADKNGANIKTKSEFGMTLMHFAAQAWTPGVVERVLKQGSDINARDWQGWTPFHYAAATPIYQNIDDLLKNGADMHIPDITNRTPVITSTLLMNDPAVDYLVKRGGKINNVHIRDGSGLFTAIQGNIPMAKKLLELGYPVETKHLTSGGTLLIEAARYAQLPVIEVLLDNGANQKAVDNEGEDFFEAYRKSNTLRSDKALQELLKRRKGS
ncbi:hypothetical protein CCB80_06715 [Armatimonadetes bacterium Uphvl-Ar1]|nr:hypothetical protein CCB80_06715 [Armatimonadetes bacterium Uphvl-Ar1]